MNITRFKRDGVTTLFAAMVLLCCFGCVPKDTRESTLPRVVAHIDTVLDENGEVILIARDYVDVLKLDGRDVRRRFQYAWNYTRGVAQLRVFSSEGQRLSTEDKPALSLVATDAENAYANSVIRSDPRWTSLYRDDSTFYGGFIYRPREHAVCGAGSRCIHVFASDTNGLNTTMHLIFDLMTDHIEVANETPEQPSRNPHAAHKENP